MTFFFRTYDVDALIITTTTTIIIIIIIIIIIPLAIWQPKRASYGF